jgi:hypothetical protein
MTAPITRKMLAELRLLADRVGRPRERFDVGSCGRSDWTATQTGLARRGLAKFFMVPGRCRLRRLRITSAGLNVLSERGP